MEGVTLPSCYLAIPYNVVTPAESLTLANVTLRVTYLAAEKRTPHCREHREVDDAGAT